MEAQCSCSAFEAKRRGIVYFFRFLSIIYIMEETLNQEEELRKSYDELCSLIASCTDEAFVKSFFECIFSPSERKNFSERWLLVKELDSGVTQREIARKYNMSLCKITRGSKELQKKDSAFRRMLEILKSRK